MSKVIVLTSGEYSAYSISGVFSSLEKAREYANRRNPKELSWNFEEYEIDAGEKELMYTFYRAVINIEDGSIWEHGKIERWGIPSNVIRDEGTKIIEVESSISQEHANKLAVEARQAYLRRKPEVAMEKRDKLKNAIAEQPQAPDVDEQASGEQP
jgi:hypothetical protein